MYLAGTLCWLFAIGIFKLDFFSGRIFWKLGILSWCFCWKNMLEVLDLNWNFGWNNVLEVGDF